MTNERLTVLQALTEQPYPPSETQSFPDTLESWFSQPNQLFSQWLDVEEVNGRLKESVKIVKRAMWNNFQSWLVKNDLNLSTCSSQNISTFLDEAGLFREHRQRYVRLIQKVYVHLGKIGFSGSNPGQKAAFLRVGRGTNEPMRCLSQPEREQLFVGLRHVWEKEGIEEKSWASVRDAAMIGVILGGGAKLAEVRNITVNCTSDDGYLLLPDAVVDEHQAPLLPIGLEALTAWRRLRTRLGIHSKMLFPADSKRRRDDQRGIFESMHPATIYRRIDAMLRQLKIDPRCFEVEHDKKMIMTTKRNGAQTLRNTYAAMLIERGESDDVLREALGLFGEVSAPRLRHAYGVWAANQ